MSTTYALVTGAAGGIGLEVAQRLSARGHTIIAVERTLELAKRTCDSIASDSVAIECDLNDRDAVVALADRIRTEWASQLEVVVCNAGIVIPGDVVDLNPRDMDIQLNVMLMSPVHLLAAAASVMKKVGRGHLMATVSMGGILSLPGSAVYSAAKAGLRAYLSSLNAELHTTGVAVTGVYPSAVDTAMLLHEANNNGSLLNFVGEIHSPATVADAFDKALTTKKLEVYVPYKDSITTRLASVYPWLIPLLVPHFQKAGERGRIRYLASKENQSN